jgi:hypothetical protein
MYLIASLVFLTVLFVLESRDPPPEFPFEVNDRWEQRRVKVGSRLVRIETWR